MIILAALPLIPLAAWLGQLVNRQSGERPARRPAALSSQPHQDVVQRLEKP